MGKPSCFITLFSIKFFAEQLRISGEVCRYVVRICICAVNTCNPYMAITMPRLIIIYYITIAYGFKILALVNLVCLCVTFIALLKRKDYVQQRAFGIGWLDFKFSGIF